MSATDLATSTGITNPLLLAQAMIEKGADPDALKKLFDLAERWEKNQAIKAFNDAMTACQAEMPTVVQDAVNPHTKSRYALLETVQRVAKPVYTKHGFSLSFSEGASPREGWQTVTAFVRHVGGHIETHSGAYPIDGSGAKGGAVMSPVQGAVSSHSYAQRDLIKLIFNITIAGEDKDGCAACVSAEQIEEINLLISEIKEQGKTFDLGRFLKWLDVEKIDELSADKGFAKAIHELNRKRKATVVK